MHRGREEAPKKSYINAAEAGPLHQHKVFLHTSKFQQLHGSFRFGL